MTAKPEIGPAETLPVPIGQRVLPSRLNFTDQLAFAKTLLDTGFLPTNLRTPGQVLAVILTGQEMSIGPMQALRSIGIINGKPVIAADLQLALFHRAGGQSKWTLLTEKEATIWLKHPGGSEHTETFTLDDAKRAGLVRAGGNYEKFPKAMLRSRAITAGLKSVGFEPTCGVYDPEELDPEPTKYEPPTAKELTEMPVPLRAPEEPLPFEQRPAGVSANGEVIDYGEPLDAAEQTIIFKLALRAGVSKDLFPGVYQQLRGRPFNGLRVEDSAPLTTSFQNMTKERAALKAQIAEKKK